MSDQSEEKPASWQLLKGLKSRMRKSDKLWELDPAAAREKVRRIGEAKSLAEAEREVVIASEKVEKLLIEKQLEGVQRRHRAEDEKRRKEGIALAKSGRRRAAEMVEARRQGNASTRAKPTKGTPKEFAAAFKAQRRAKKNRRQGDLTPAPMEAAFEQLYQAAHVRLRFPPNEFLDPYGLGKKLAAKAETLDELEVAKILVMHVLESGELFQRFMRNSYIPRFNALNEHLRRCEECFRVFVPSDRRDRFCNSNCAARARNRGRPRKSSAHRRADLWAKKEEDFLRAHFGRCVACKQGGLCPVLESRLQKQDALSRATRVYDDDRLVESPLVAEPEDDEQEIE